MTAPRPLGPASRLLADRRVEVGYCVPNDRGSVTEIRTARFQNRADAIRYADGEWADAPLIHLTGYSKLNGWQPRGLARRVDGVWTDFRTAAGTFLR